MDLDDMRDRLEQTLGHPLESEVEELLAEVEQLRAQQAAALDLADELEQAGGGQNIECEAVTDEYAARIREALGVTT